MQTIKSIPINRKGTTIHRVTETDFEFACEDLIDLDFVRKFISDNGVYYVSSGFINMLKEETIQDNEWHHVFIKSDINFNSFRFFPKTGVLR
jgi:hypothetical protein